MNKQFSVPQIEYQLGAVAKKGSHVYFLLQVFWVILLFDMKVVLILQWWPDVTIVQSDVTIVVPWQLSTGSIHDYLFYYCPLVCVLFEVLKIVPPLCVKCVRGTSVFKVVYLCIPLRWHCINDVYNVAGLCVVIFIISALNKTPRRYRIKLHTIPNHFVTSLVGIISLTASDQRCHVTKTSVKLNLNS